MASLAFVTCIISLLSMALPSLQRCSYNLQLPILTSITSLVNGRPKDAKGDTFPGVSLECKGDNLLQYPMVKSAAPRVVFPMIFYFSIFSQGTDCCFAITEGHEKPLCFIKTSWK